MPLVSVSKASKLFQVSRPTLQKALKNGTLSAVKSVDGKVETWQIDTAELSRLYSLRGSNAAVLPRQEERVEQPNDMAKSSDTNNLPYKVVRGLEDELQAVKEELAAALAVSEERRRLLDEMVKALPRPVPQEAPKKGFWDRLRGR